jgi:hypothetical protein
MSNVNINKKMMEEIEQKERQIKKAIEIITYNNELMEEHAVCPDRYDLKTKCINYDCLNCWNHAVRGIK